MRWSISKKKAVKDEKNVLGRIGDCGGEFYVDGVYDESVMEG